MNHHIAFDKIRGDLPEGQRGAFEELVSQLARRAPENVGSFRRIEGAGGDGGVECVHDRRGGGIVGYQAKYHVKAGDIDWNAIDRSVRTALAIYPDLVTYVIAIPCDFTGRRRVKGGDVGEGAWGEWDARVERWETEAASAGRFVEFVAWTAHELLARLTPIDAAGLRSYWFSAVEFSTGWFNHHIHLATVALDDRYHPDDHVDVTSQELFEVIARHTKTREKLTAGYEAIRALGPPAGYFLAAEPQPPTELLSESIHSVEVLLECEAEVSSPIWKPWDAEKWKRVTADAIASVGKLSRWSWDTQTESKEKNDHARSELQKLGRELQEFRELLHGRFFSAERTRAALVDGRAGSGKSHLLARVAEIAVGEGSPVVLVLGQQLREQGLWPQILERLDLAEASTDEFLGALDAAAECVGTRGLILVDAVNEGAGAKLWRNELASFLAQIGCYSNLACVISCRSEYVDYLVPSGVLAALPRIEIHGFETADEQASAARVYLDRRGISRPATPWLAPEFVNPLFLRSCCIALNRDGKSEFPRGLSGTKAILAFFINSVARHLGAGRDGSDELIGPTKETLVEIATRMAGNRQNYLARNSAAEIANRHFKLFQAPADLSWLDLLQRNGLLRFDPNPEAEIANPLRHPLDVVRFGFQRFQDHLMAEALLVGVDDAKVALAEGGSLAFVHDGRGVNWEWRGVIEALSIQLPERLKIELVDALPGGNEKWWQEWEIQDAFAESIRWRDGGAFSDRTLELFNWLFGTHRNPFSLLIELSASVNHPWNADLIHRNLVKRPIAERDAFWTVEVNAATDEESHAIHRLIDWCSRPQAQQASTETLRLCALVLAWCFASSSRPIRDRATKALTTIMVHHPDLFSELLRAFRGVDDLYVWERLFGAAFRVCCIENSAQRVRAYAELTAETLFSGPSPPPNLLLRDYGRGIIELAEQLGVVPDIVKLAGASPPYVSTLPRLTLTKAAVRKVAAAAGDNTILRSCEGYGDFGRYTIEHSVRDFTMVKLSHRVPLTAREKLDRFEREVIDPHPVRVVALKRLRDVKSLNFRVVWMGEKPRRKLSKRALQKWAADVSSAEQELLALLGAKERRRYQVDARPELGIATNRRGTDPKHIDPEGAKRWVAKRAYEFGWTKSRFPHEVESHYFRSESGRPEVERIGKKYQWLALSELLCGLADNHWIGGGYGDNTRRYNYSTDIGFIRDIDPTVVPIQENLFVPENSRRWTAGPNISIPATPEEQLTKWPFLEEPGDSLPALSRRIDPDGCLWTTLYEHRSVTTKYETRQVQLHGLRQQEFRFVYSVLVESGQREALIEDLKETRKVDVHSWDPPEFTDGPYLLEATWRGTWSQERWRDDGWGARKGIRISFPVLEYMWESHLDASLPKGARAFVPAPWLTRQLGISPDRADSAIHRDLAGKVRFISSKSEPDGSCALIESACFQQFLERELLDCVWFFVAERNAWPGGDNESAAWRRTEGFCWIENGHPKAITWNEDRVNDGGAHQGFDKEGVGEGLKSIP